MVLQRIYKNTISIIKYVYLQENKYFFVNTHICGTNYDDAVKYTSNSISQKSEFYVFTENKNIFGFFVKDIQEGIKVLGAFHVVNNFRQKKYLSFFWEKIKSVFKTDFYVGIFKKNIAAINHIKKQKVELINNIDNFLIFKICQLQ